MAQSMGEDLKSYRMCVLRGTEKGRIHGGGRKLETRLEGGYYYWFDQSGVLHLCFGIVPAL